jgi:hypothetical protein
MQQANGESSTGGAAGGRNWQGRADPYLQVIMCLTQDHVKCLFLTQANVRTRREKDGHNCEIRYKEEGRIACCDVIVVSLLVQEASLL